MTRPDYSAEDHPPMAPILVAIASVPVVFVVAIAVGLFWLGAH